MAERPPRERKPVGHAQYHPTSGTGQRHGQRRVENTDRTRRRERAGRRDVLVAASTAPREGVREERHGSETQIGRRRPHKLKPRGDAGATRAVESVEMRTSSVEEGKAIRSRIGTSTSRRRAPDGRSPGRICGWHVGRVASRERTGRRTRSGNQHEHQSQERPDEGATGTATGSRTGLGTGVQRWQRVRDPESDAALLRSRNRTTGERARRGTSSMVQ